MRGGWRAGSVRHTPVSGWGEWAFPCRGVGAPCTATPRCGHAALSNGKKAPHRGRGAAVAVWAGVSGRPVLSLAAVLFFFLTATPPPVIVSSPLPSAHLPTVSCCPPPSPPPRQCRGAWRCPVRPVPPPLSPPPSPSPLLLSSPGGGTRPSWPPPAPVSSSATSAGIPPMRACGRRLRMGWGGGPVPSLTPRSLPTATRGAAGTCGGGASS